MIFDRLALLGMDQNQAGADKGMHRLAGGDHLIPKCQRFFDQLPRHRIPLTADTPHCRQRTGQLPHFRMKRNSGGPGISFDDPQTGD